MDNFSGGSDYVLWFPRSKMNSATSFLLSLEICGEQAGDMGVTIYSYTVSFSLKYFVSRVKK